MSQLYQDSMAIAREFGPASYFITVTANPQWQEIQSALLLGQAANDHPDLVVRVFHKKLSLLLRHLKSVFGHQVACVHAIEYQKCGLPHAHILLWIGTEHQPHSAEDMDKVGFFLFFVFLFWLMYDANSFTNRLYGPTFLTHRGTQSFFQWSLHR